MFVLVNRKPRWRNLEQLGAKIGILAIVVTGPSLSPFTMEHGLRGGWTWGTRATVGMG